MLARWARAGAIALSALCAVLSVAQAEPAPAASGEAWVGSARALAERIAEERLVLTDALRAENRAQGARLSGQARLMALYDAAADDLIASSAERAAVSLPALEAAAANDARFRAMAGMLRAYQPSLDGDYVRARSQLEAALAPTTDAYARAAGQRLLSYVLTDLGLVGNALEAARAGFSALPQDDTTLTLRSGLRDAMSYTYRNIGDDAAAFEQMRRSFEFDELAHRPIDGLSFAYNIARMLANAQREEAALRVVEIVSELARISGGGEDAFFADLLCAKVNLAAARYVPAAQCAQSAARNESAPREYMGQLLIVSVIAEARLGHAPEARAALDALRRLADEREDPALLERIAAAAPEVLYAEGRKDQAFLALRSAYEVSERETLKRFNAGVRELRATMENEVARAEERAAAQELRGALQQRTLEVLMLTASLAGACFVAAAIIAFLIHRSRRAMLAAVGRAEGVLTGGGGARVMTSASLTQRLGTILDEIAKRDAALRVLVEDLKTARATAEEASAAKSRFLATMSHELRTPLNAIIGYSEILQESADVDGRKADVSDLSRILLAARTLLGLINDLLDLTKAEAGKMVPSVTRFDVATLVSEAVSIVKPAALVNRNRLHIEIAPDVGQAASDQMRVNQCLLNLLSNAVKFTKAGDVRVRVRRERRAGRPDVLSFEVADTGIGIAPENMDKLFLAFSQADASTTRSFGGTGLGLAITRRLARMLGGDVSVKSELGRGSTFTLRILAEFQAPEARPAAA